MHRTLVSKYAWGRADSGAHVQHEDAKQRAERKQADAQAHINTFKERRQEAGVRSIHLAAGAEAHGCILSLGAGRDELSCLDLTRVDPKTCFRV